MEAGLDDVEGMGEAGAVGGEEGSGDVFEGGGVEAEKNHAASGFPNKRLLTIEFDFSLLNVIYSKTVLYSECHRIVPLKTIT